MKITNSTVTFASVGAILVLLALGCGEIKSGPDWVKSKKIAGKEQKLSHISGLVIDDKFSYVKIGGTIADANAGTNGLRRVALDTGEVTSLDNGEQAPQSENGGMAVDEKYVYWKAAGSIMRISKDGGKAEAVVTENVGIGIDLAMDNERIYWVNHGYYSAGEPATPKPIYSVLKSGGKSEVFADAQMIPHSLAVDDKFVYWHTRTAIMKQAKSGGQPQSIFSIGDKEGLDELSLDADNIYFGYRGPGEGRWSLRKISKAGGKPVTLVERYSVKPVVVDDLNVYFFDEESMTSDALCRVPKNGGEVTRLDVGYASGVIAQSKTLVFFAGGDDILSFGK